MEIRDFVFLAEVRNPAVEREEGRAVTQHVAFAEFTVEIDLDRRTAFVLRGFVRRHAVGFDVFAFVLLTVLFAEVVDEIFTDLLAFDEDGAQGDRRHIDFDRKALVGTVVGQTDRQVEIPR